MPSAQSEGWNPRWLAFLGEKGLATAQADAMDRHNRTSLNAEFICWNIDHMPPESKRRFFP